MKGGGRQPGIFLSFLPVSVPRCCVARRLGAGTCKVVFAKPHRDSCSWGALRACSWGEARDGHVHGVASRRSRQSCSLSTAASLTSCRAARTMSTAPSTGTEAHERRAHTTTRTTRAGVSTCARPDVPGHPSRHSVQRTWEGFQAPQQLLCPDLKSIKARLPRFSLVKATLLVHIVISGLCSF